MGSGEMRCSMLLVTILVASALAAEPSIFTRLNKGGEGAVESVQRDVDKRIDEAIAGIKAATVKLADKQANEGKPGVNDEKLRTFRHEGDTNPPTYPREELSMQKVDDQ